MFQREPGWVTPKGDRDFTPDERRVVPQHLAAQAERWRLKYVLEKSSWGGAIYRPGNEVNQKREQFCRDYIHSQFADRPDLIEARHAEVPLPRQAPGVHRPPSTRR